MFCKNCGQQIDDNAVVCPHCGVAQTQNPVAPATDPLDAPSTGFAVLGFFFPVIGLILYLVWHSTSPLKAKSCGKGALIGFIVEFVLGIVYGVIIAMAAGSYMNALASFLVL